MSGTTRVICTCKHDAQDKLYGPQARVANATMKGDKDFTEVRCTVCKAVHRVKHSKVKQ